MFEIRGLDEAIRKLDRLKDNARRLDGTHEVPFSELFNPAFMRRHTNAVSFDALVEAGGFKVESQAGFEAIPDAEWEKVIRSHTSFSSWEGMRRKAAEEYLSQKLTEGV